MNISQIPHILICIKHLVMETQLLRLNFESTTAAQGTLQTVTMALCFPSQVKPSCCFESEWCPVSSNITSTEVSGGQVKKSCRVHRTDSMASGMAAEALVWCVTSGEVSSSAWTLATASTRTSASSPSCCCSRSRFFFISCWLMWWRIPAPRASPSTFTTVVVRSLQCSKWT